MVLKKKRYREANTAERSKHITQRAPFAPQIPVMLRDGTFLSWKSGMDPEAAKKDTRKTCGKKMAGGGQVSCRLK